MECNRSAAAIAEVSAPSTKQSQSAFLVLLLLCLSHSSVAFLDHLGSNGRYFTYGATLPPLEKVRQPLQNHTDSSFLLSAQRTPSNPMEGSTIPVMYTNNPKSVYEWLSDHLPTDGCILGFDIEAKPTLWKRHTPGAIVSPFDCAATVQLATPEAALVIHLANRKGRHSEACAPVLKAVLCDHNFVKAGCALDEDLMSLYELWGGGVEARSRLDLGFVGNKDRANRYGLKSLSQLVLGVELTKSKRIAMSDWSSVPLNRRQITYSARDAWAGAAIAAKLAHLHPETFGRENLVEHLVAAEPPISDLVRKQRRRDEAKERLRRLLSPYQSEMWTVPTSVEEEVRSLREIIDTRVMDRHLVFEVEDVFGSQQ